MDEVDGFVAVHADAVAGAVRGSGQTVARAIAPAFILAADGIVDAAGRAAKLRRAHGDLLALVDLVPDTPLRRSRLAENEGARYVGLVAFDAAPAVEQHHLVLAD